MKVQEMRQKTDKDLLRELRDAKASQVELRFSVAGGNIKDLQAMKDARKRIARIATLLRERNIRV